MMLKLLSSVITFLMLLTGTVCGACAGSCHVPVVQAICCPCCHTKGGTATDALSMDCGTAGTGGISVSCNDCCAITRSADQLVARVLVRTSTASAWLPSGPPAVLAEPVAGCQLVQTKRQPLHLASNKIYLLNRSLLI